MGVGEAVRSMIGALEAHDGVDLSPVERMLMATDGTVTHVLEALTMSDVNVDIIDRETDGSTLHRQVVLRRARDGSPLIWAESDVNLYPLPMEMQDELVAGDIGIGDLLQEEYAETRREVESMTAVWAEADSLPDFIDGHSALYLRRRYSVYSGGDRVMEIAEYFPKGLF